MGIAEIIKYTIEIGITPVLLVVFVKYFIDRDKNRDEMVKMERMESLKKIDDAGIRSNERERLILTESARREELIREDASKREEIIREESKKREGVLMINIEKISDTMASISNTMQSIQVSTEQIQLRMERVEDKLKMREE